MMGSNESVLSYAERPPRVSRPSTSVTAASTPEEGLRLSSGIPGSRLVILPDTGHIPQEETPEEFSRAVSQFLGEVSHR